MPVHRRILLLITVAIVVGSLSATMAYSLHLRGDGYRRSLEHELSELLDVRLSIGGIEPLSFSERRLTDVRATLPRRDEEVFRCNAAVWSSLALNGEPGYALDIGHGRVLVGADAWDAADYGRLLRTGFGHDFASLGVREIRLNDIDFEWRHRRYSITADATGGVIRFDGEGMGSAVLSTTRLNGGETTTPIEITARFTPGAQMRFHEVRFNVASCPLSALRLDDLVGSAVTRGRFSGRVVYRESDDGPVADVRGEVSDAHLSELTGPLPGGPYDGRVDVVVDEAVFDETSLRTLRFNGGLTDLSLDQLAPLGRSAIGGRVSLYVHQATFEGGVIRYFSAEGLAEKVSLDALTAFIGRGRVTGALRVDIHSLLIIGDRVVGADVSVEAVPPAGEPGIMDRNLLRTATTRALGFDATAILPDSIEGVEYARLGLRLKLSGDELRVLGSHGEDGRTILTVLVFGQELAVLKQPDEPIGVADLMAVARKHLDKLSSERLRSWLGVKSTAKAEDR